MFNHSTQDQNVVWERDAERLTITYRAQRDIAAGEELCKRASNDFQNHSIVLNLLGISYGSHLTFKDADAPVPPPPEEEMEQLIQIQLD